MNETLIFFKIVPLPYNLYLPILEGFLIIETTLKSLFDIIFLIV